MARYNGKIQHPSPTPTTAKQLYGAAVACGYPACYEPPYKVVDGVLALNSQIAHIHARSEGGPRWLASMSSEENQAAENLIILCQFHHGVVDDLANETRYPANLLRQWKTAQIELATNSPAYARPLDISEAQAAEVLRVSEEREFALIDRILPLVKVVTRLVATIEQSRQGTREAAGQWQAEVDRWRRRPVGWDPITGENVYASPPPATRDEYAALVQTSLDGVVDVLQPLLIEVETELVAAITGVDSAGPWASWLRRSIEEVARCATTPGAVSVTDDTSFTTAIDAVRESLQALVLHLRRLDAPEPPEIQVEEEPPDTFSELLVEHREVLDRGRPFSRVSDRPFDFDLHDEVATQTRVACHLPSSGYFITLDLLVTASIAADIARRGLDEDLQAIIVGHTHRKPAAAAAYLLFRLKQVLEEDGRDGLAEHANEALEQLIEQFDWCDTHEWQANGLYSGLMLDVFATVITTEIVRERLIAAAKISPQLGVCIVLAVAGSSIQTNRMTGDSTCKRHFRFPKEWLPVEDLLISVETASPEMKSAEVMSLIGELKDLRDGAKR